MCGIVGIFDIHGKHGLSQCPTYWAERASEVAKGMDAMRLRGPHGSGIHTRPGVILGHRRLAIIDLEGGKQPFIDKRTGVALVFNGEIFNFREIRAQLAAAGHSFQTESDTEVLLHAYLEWDTDCLDHLSGMFAFAIHDPDRSRLFIARDRLGVKPLLFSCKHGQFMFASSYPALRCFSDIDSHIDLVTASHYLSTIRTTMGRRTLFRDIQSLQPGEYLLATEGQSEPSIRRYWDIPVVAPDDKNEPGIATAAGHVRELLENAVKQQLISDVPLGGFLSGGIDSSVIASLACRHTSGNYSTYSVGYNRDGYNEWPFVDRATEHHHMSCRKIILEENAYAEDRSRLIEIKGSPISTPNEIPIYRLAHSLKEDFTVALSGEGADEVFGGYTIPYFSAYDYERSRRSMPPTDWQASPTDMAIRRLYGRPYLLCRPDHYFLTNSWIPLARKRALLTEDAWESIDQDEAMFRFYEDMFRKFEDCSTFDAYMHIHAKVNMEGLLSRVDSSTMAASVEARVPFTDHKLLEYMFGLPDNYKIDWKNQAAKEAASNLNVAEIDKQGLISSKILLRHAFRNDISPTIMQRPKVSFPVPFLEWIADSMREQSEDILRTSPLVGDFFDQTAVDKMLRMPDRQDFGMALWALTNLCLWQQKCKVSLS